MTMETFNNKAARRTIVLKTVEAAAHNGRSSYVDTGWIIIGRVNCALVVDDRPLSTVNNSATFLFSALFRGWTRSVKRDHRLCARETFSGGLLFNEAFVMLPRRNIAILINQAKNYNT